MAEVKAPLVVLYKGKEEPACTAENLFYEGIEQIHEGVINTAYTCAPRTGQRYAPSHPPRGPASWRVMRVTLYGQPSAAFPLC